MRLTPRQWATIGLLVLGVYTVYACLASQVLLNPQQPLPAIAARLPTITPRPTALPSPTLLIAPTFVVALPPTETAMPVLTDTPLPSATETSSPTPTNSPSPTLTPPPTHTPLWATVAPRAWGTATPSGLTYPTLDDFWGGRAIWQLEIYDAGLPIGESDTLIGPDGRLWSYLHASWPSRGIRDQWGEPVVFPGCVTLWTSDDRGARFSLFAPQCLLQCRGKPCGAGPDDIDQQQYPRVARAEDGLFYMVYEWRGQTYFRTSADGLNWSWSRYVKGTGQWAAGASACQPYQVIGPHPLVKHDYDCLSGAPPGIYVDGDWLYVFVGMGKNPAHMGCFYGRREERAAGLRLCDHNPLFTGVVEHGPLDAVGPGANPYFDFHLISSADVLRLDDHFYMVYEGIRGDGQFNLGLARSREARLDGPWDKYPGNPILMDAPGNVGVGHGDLIVLDGTTYLYTATSAKTRGRYELVWRP